MLLKIRQSLRGEMRTESLDSNETMLSRAIDQTRKTNNKRLINQTSPLTGSDDRD